MYIHVRYLHVHTSWRPGTSIPILNVHVHVHVELYLESGVCLSYLCRSYSTNDAGLSVASKRRLEYTGQARVTKRDMTTGAREETATA